MIYYYGIKRAGFDGTIQLDISCQCFVSREDLVQVYMNFRSVYVVVAEAIGRKALGVHSKHFLYQQCRSTGHAVVLVCDNSKPR